MTDKDRRKSAMRICFFIERFLPYIGGGQIHLLELSRAMSKKNVDVQIITDKHGGCPNHEFCEGFEVHRVGFPAKMKREFKIFPYIFSSFDRVLEIDHLTKIDLIHSHITFGAFASHFSKIVMRQPHLLTVHGLYADVFKSSYPDHPNFFQKMIERSILRLPYVKIICVSEALSRQLHSMGVPDHKLAVVSNGVDVERFNPDVESLVKSRLGIENYFLVSFFGRLWPVKGIEFLIRAVPEVTSRISNVKFLIVGDGPQKRYLRRMVHDMNVEDSVIFRDRVEYDSMHVFLRGSDAVVLPSLMEGLPLIALEAMACGTPVIATSVGGTPEIVKDGETGVLVKPYSAGCLAAGIISLYGNDSLRNHISAEGLKLVRGRYTWSTIAERTISLYNSVLEGS